MDIASEEDTTATSMLKSKPKTFTKHYIGVSPLRAYELIEKLGEGTFGEVYKGVYRGRWYARKQKMDEMTSQTKMTIQDESSDEDEEGVDDGILELNSSVKAGMVVAVKRIIVHNELDGVSFVPLRSFNPHCGLLTRFFSYSYLSLLCERFGS